MNLRHLAAFAALTAAAIGGSAIAHAGGTEDLGEFTVGDTIMFTFDCPNDGNDFFLFLGNSKVDEATIDASADYLLGYPYNTSNLEPGVYSVGIECFESEGIYDFEFTLVAADPCAPVDTVEVPKGPGRAPHGAPIDCSDSGLPDAGSNTSTVLLFGSLAIVGGTGLLIARRRTLA